MEHEEHSDNEQELTIEQEYQLWRKNVPLMYNYVSETSLTWPSLTFQWLPNGNVILGTHTSDQDDNYLKIGSLDENNTLKVISKFKHDKEVNRARYIDETKIATINADGVVFVFDTVTGNSTSYKYHTENGYGLSSGIGGLLSCSDDGSVALWDISSTTPKQTFKNHSDIVNDITWRDASSYVSCSDDKTIKLVSLSGDISTVATSENIISLATNPFAENLLAAGDDKGQIHLYDLRTMGELYTMTGHTESITTLQFNPHKDGILASGSSDRRCMLWDLTRIGAELVSEEIEDGSSELLMMHAGHRGGVNDLCWHPTKPWTLGSSSSDDNVVQIWEPCDGLRSDAVLDVELRSLE